MSITSDTKKHIGQAEKEGKKSISVDLKTLYFICELADIHVHLYKQSQKELLKALKFVRKSHHIDKCNNRNGENCGCGKQYLDNIELPQIVDSKSESESK